MSSDRVRCDECDWTGRINDQLKAANPFDHEDAVYGCPQCKGVDQFTMLCEVEDCYREATCGTPKDDHYWQTCGRHAPK